MRPDLGIAAAACWIVACGSDAVSGGPCTVGATASCTCPDGRPGTRECGADGAHGECSCGGSGDCRLGVDTSVVAFGPTCPGGEAMHTIELENRGAGPCTVELVVDGEWPQPFEVIATPPVVEVGVRAAASVTYRPAAGRSAEAGDPHHGRLLISSNDPANPVIEVFLEGTTAIAPDQAVLSIACAPSVRSCADPARTSDEPCCLGRKLDGGGGPPGYARAYLMRVDFGAVDLGQTATLPIEVRNLGCESLELSDMNLEPEIGRDLCSWSTVGVVPTLPITVPGAASPAQIQTATIELQFQPSERCTYLAGVEVGSNDPDLDGSAPLFGDLDTFILRGAGVEIP